MRLHGIEIPVVNLDRAYKFYSEIIEFPVIGRFTENSAMFFLNDPHGGMVTLVQGANSPHGEGTALVLSAEGDIEATRARLESRGAIFLGPTSAGLLGQTAEFLDSEGNRLALFDSAITAQFRETAEKPNLEICAALDKLEAQLSAALDDVGAEQAAFRSAPGEWSILGQIGHIVDQLESCGVIAHELAKGRPPPRDRGLEAEYPTESVEAARVEATRAFDEARRWVKELPEAVEPKASLMHGVFGDLGAREWVAFLLFHVNMHIGQIGEIKTKPAYPVEA